MRRAKIHALVITFLGRGDHINRLGRENKQCRWEFIPEKPELTSSISNDAVKLAGLDATGIGLWRMIHIHASRCSFGMSSPHRSCPSE
jgi:hypothetical protein